MIDSTNRYLLDEAAQGAPDGLVTVAEHQTRGRGRRDRVWDSKPGASLLFSVLFRPPSEVEAQALENYPRAVALAVLDACAVVGGFTASLKWPNDVVVGDRKLAGLLTETASTDGRITAVVVGCGINLNWQNSLSDSLSATAISADEVAGRSVDLGEFLDGILRGLGQRLAEPSWIADAYRSRCSTLGSRVRVELDAEELVGTAVAVAASGALVVEDDSGDRREVMVGDVVHLRTDA